MMNRLLRAFLIAGLVIGLASAGWAQRQYGMIHGRVLNSTQKPMADVSVLLYGTSLMGSKTYITEKSGEYHFIGLLPGVYMLRLEMPGFKTQVRKDIIVELGKTFDWTTRLEAAAGGEMAAEEEVTVSLPSPMIDLRSPAMRTVYDTLLLSTLPVNRDLYDLQNTLPGAVSEDMEFLRTSSILGGTVRSQLLTFDGAFINDPVNFGLMANANVEVLDSIEFEQAGHPAESGQTGSTYVNILAKAGGNRMTGSLAGYVGGTDLNKVLVSQDEINRLHMSPPQKYNAYGDFSLALGGPILEDTVWFYLNARHLAWDRTNPFTPENRMAALQLYSPHYDFQLGEWLIFSKVTFEYGKALRYSGVFDYHSIYEPVAFDSISPSSSFDYTSILQSETVLTTTHQLMYQLNPTTLAEARGTYIHRARPFTRRDDKTYTSYDLAQDVFFGSAPFNDTQRSTRLSGLASITKYADDVLGADHELKAGAEFEQSEGSRDWFKANPYNTFWYDFANGNPYFYSPALKQGRLSISPCPTTADAWAPKTGLRRMSAFAQDNFRTGRLAFDLGVRLDYSYLYLSSESRPDITPTYNPQQQVSGLATNALLAALLKQMKDQGHVLPLAAYDIVSRSLASFVSVSPRAGFVVDLFGTGRTALKASAARYHEPFWVQLFSYDQILAPTTLDWRWNDLNGNDLMDLPGTDSYELSHYPNQSPALNSYLSTIKAPFTDEIQAGIEQELFPHFKIGLNFIYKIDKNIVDSFDANNGYDVAAQDGKGPIWIPFTFADPGADGALGTGDDRSLTVYGLRKDRPAPSYVIGNIPGAQRKYMAAVLSFDKRLADNWELKASLTYSSYKGNFGAGTTDTNYLNPVYNDPNTLVNAYGPLSFDRPWQFKLMGTWIMPWDVIVSAYFQAYSGIPWNRTLARVYFPLDFAAAYGGVQTPYATVNAEPPGSHRYRSYVNLDLHLEKAFALGGVKLAVIADIFNLLGRKGQILYTDSAGTLHFDTTPATYTPAANFGQVASLYGVRAVRLGMRLGF
jgi:hypothetical protein